MENKAIEILKSNKDKLDALVQGLLDHESLSKKEVDELIGLNAEPDDEKENRDEI